MWDRSGGLNTHVRQLILCVCLCVSVYKNVCVNLLQPEPVPFTLADLLQGSNDPFSFPRVRNMKTQLPTIKRPLFSMMAGNCRMCHMI